MRLLLACRGGCVETNIETITVGVGDGHSGGMCDGAHRGSERPRSRGVSDGNCGASWGRYAYVVGSNFDLDYRANDGGAIYVVDLETKKVLPGSKRMGSFGTNIVLSHDARRGYTVTRGDDALVWFEISPDGSSISCPLAKKNSDSLLKCRQILDDNPTHVSITRSYREYDETNADGTTQKKRVDFDLLAVAQLRNARTTMLTVHDVFSGE